MSKNLTEALRLATGQTYWEAYTSYRPQELKPAPAPAPIPARTGRAVSKLKDGSGTGGIASPLTEATVDDREYYEQGYTTTDGLFFLPAIKTVKLADADNADVLIHYANPAPPAP